MTQWQDDAACRGQTHLFFPTTGQHGLIKKARKLCATCPVAKQCAFEAAALHSIGELHGVWAGQTMKQRDREHGRHRRAWWTHE